VPVLCTTLFRIVVGCLVAWCFFVVVRGRRRQARSQEPGDLHKDTYGIHILYYYIECVRVKSLGRKCLTSLIPSSVYVYIYKGYIYGIHMTSIYNVFPLRYPGRGRGRRARSQEPASMEKTNMVSIYCCCRLHYPGCAIK